MRRKFLLIFGHFLLGSVLLGKLGGALLRGVERLVVEHVKDVMPVTDGVVQFWVVRGEACGGGVGVGSFWLGGGTGCLEFRPELVVVVGWEILGGGGESSNPK